MSLGGLPLLLAGLLRLLGGRFHLEDLDGLLDIVISKLVFDRFE